MRCFALKQGMHHGEGAERKYYQPKGMNELGGFEFNMEHGLLEEIPENALSYANWGEGRYKEVDGRWVCVSSDWDSSG